VRARRVVYRVHGWGSGELWLDGERLLWHESPRAGGDEDDGHPLGERLRAFFAGEPRHDFLRLNYSNRPPELIEEGMARLGRVVRRHLG